MFIRKVLALLLIACLLFPPSSVFAVSASDAIVGIALNYYNKGYYDEALHEFSKVLLLEPDNEQAYAYIQQIRQKQAVQRAGIRVEEVVAALDEFEQSDKMPAPVDRDVIINRELDKRTSVKKQSKPPVVQHHKVNPKVKKALEKRERTGDYVDMKGEFQVSAGTRSSNETIWKEANADLNEKNYRILWSKAKHNTFDPAIFDRIRLDLDTKNLDELGLDNLSAHTNITVDPWSFTGKSDKFTIPGAGGDAAEFELKYWSNTGNTLNEIIYTLNNGDALATPEINVKNNMTSPATVTSTFGNIFTIPAQKIHREFLPIREFWVEYKDDQNRLRVFPIAYQNQALSTDDPLMLSNRHTWWEESPWLAEWKPGNVISGPPAGFRKGVWDDSLAFFTRDSDGLRLTSLRGFSFAYDGSDTKVQSTLASPKNLWGDYGNFETYAAATRLKHDIFYNLGIGLTHTGHFGYSSSRLDSLNNSFSVDAKHEPIIGTKVAGQIATSESSIDRTNKDFSTRKRGNAYIVSLVNRFPADEVYEQDFSAIKINDDEDSFLKSKFQIARMDNGFESSLATYRQTRDDEFWSRHISFRKHPLSLYTGMTSPMKWDDIKTFAIGDGIDAGRDVIGLRLEGSTKVFDRDLDGFFDSRNVHKNSGAFIENVSRMELSYESSDRLTTRFLGIRHNLHETYAGLDPFIFDPYTGKQIANTAIAAGQDPSLATASLGFDYKLSDKFSFNSVYEHTNDSTVATDNYPRGLFNSASQTATTENGKTYWEPIPFLYTQTPFGLPPYDYFDIYKFGFSYSPVNELEFYLDISFNENKKFGQIDDNMNHYGLEIAYTPTPRLSFFFKYAVSRWIDMLELNSSGLELYDWHNNFFLQSRYNLSDSAEFVFDYGVGGITPLGTDTYDPFGGALAVLDTQHIMRLYFKKRF